MEFSKILVINQSESSITFKKIFIFFDDNQSESSISSQVIFVAIINQNEVITDFEIFFSSKQTMFLNFPINHFY